MPKKFSRIQILKTVTLVALAIIAVRLFAIQIIEHDAWVAKANEQHTLLETITAKRGEIYMMDGSEPTPVVMNQTVYQVIIDPAVTKKDEIKQVLETYAKDYITANLDDIYNIEGLRYYVVAKNIPYSIATKIAEAEVSSVWLKKGNQRVYPEGEMGSTLLGFVNADGIGQYGVEGSLNKLLSGTDGLLKTISDVNNVALSIGTDNIKIPAEDGKDVVLSVDRGLEKGIEEIAATHIENTAATNAAVLVMNPNTGEVIAMTSLPNYDPANYGQVKDASAYINQVTEVPYEPASIFKNFTFSAAINEEKMTADTTYFNTPYTEVDGNKIWNAEQRATLNNQTLTMKQALYWSLNVGSIQALKFLGDNPDEITATGRERLYHYYYDKFRLGQATGIELIEAEGFIWDPHAEIYGLNAAYANMTFGQNLSATMIQTATAFSAVVNGGYWRTPTIVKGTLENNEIIPIDSEKVEDKILSDETSATMRDMLINNRNYKVRSGIDKPGYAIGGKSGTAQVVVNGAYDDTMSNLVGSYIGFVGSEGELPEYVIMVKMWGEGQALSGGEAQNLFDSLSNYVIKYLKIKPVL
ncbi:penicillin-binding protein 2 [Candidatus Saccharibacteria bacterium]|nr:penicillin-binding protein 2 [Candidatus Saccharibacteria bacterium]MBR0242882.1 penicillin-binding protein 2 [Candidatus Saccharibacteria bacterium]